jgi:hypothetical protein
MKRFLIIIFAVIIIPTSSFALSSTGRKMRQKFTIMTDEEILEMYDLILDQFERRNLSPYSSMHGVVVPAGTYQVGIDIPAGSYRLEFPDDDFDSGRLFTYNKDGSINKILFVGKLENVQTIGKLDLIDGTYFDLEDTTAIFYKYAGLLGDFNE